MLFVAIAPLDYRAGKFDAKYRRLRTGDIFVAWVLITAVTGAAFVTVGRKSTPQPPSRPHNPRNGADTQNRES